MPHYVPVMLNLEGRRCVIIGGGAVAERKTLSLRDSGAELVIISPSVTSGLRNLAEQGRVSWLERGYQAGDLKGAFLVYAATDRPDINEAVVQEANDWGIPVNHAGDGSKGSFITPSTVRRGDLVVSVSTSGAGPSVSRALSREIDERFGSDYEIYIEFLKFSRSVVKEQVSDVKLRAKLLKSLADMDALTAIREGRFRPWSEQELLAWINGHREE